MNPELISTFLWTLIMFCCPDPTWTTRAEDTALLEVETKMTIIVDRMERMEAEMKALRSEMETKDQRIEILKADMAMKGNALKVEIEDKDQRTAALEEEMKRLRGRVTETEETDLQLREMVDQVRNPPFAFQCAWQDYWNSDNSIIHYDRLTYDEISGGTIFNVTGGMDISTGVFTVGHGFSGVYSVTYCIDSRQYSGTPDNYAWIYLNGVRIEESVHNTYNYNSGNVGSLGSRTLHMRLEEGDQVTLRTGEINRLYSITVCFELSQFDYNPNP